MRWLITPLGLVMLAGGVFLVCVVIPLGLALWQIGPAFYRDDD